MVVFQCPLCLAECQRCAHNRGGNCVSDSRLVDSVIYMAQACAGSGQAHEKCKDYQDAHPEVKTRWCGNCVDIYTQCKYGPQCMDSATHPSAKFWRWDHLHSIDNEERSADVPTMP